MGEAGTSIGMSRRGVGSLVEQGVRRFDDFQQRHRVLAQPIGTIRKYADDRGSAFAGLLTFQVFLGMLPLLVVALTVLGHVLESSASFKQSVLNSTLGQFPVIGDGIKHDVSALSASGWWIWITLLGLLWTATGIYTGFQLTLNQVWNVSGVSRQGFVSRQVRALVLFVLVFAAAIGTGFLRRFDLLSLPSWPVAQSVSLLIGSVIASVLLLGVFRIVISPEVPTRSLLLAAVLAGITWELIQRLGSWLVLHRLSNARNLYGVIGFVVVTLGWINLLARSMVLANEFAVVTHRSLWPRRIAQPPLTEADREALVGLVRNELRRPEEHIMVRFDPTGDDGGSPLVYLVDPETSDRGDPSVGTSEANPGEAPSRAAR